MSEEKKYTEREAVLREQAAFSAGVDSLYVQPEIEGGPFTGAAAHRVKKLAVERYPLPKVTRPREALDEHGRRWRHVDGRFEMLRLVPGAHWEDINTSGAVVSLTPHRVAMWADLLANSTEEVDDA